MPAVKVTSKIPKDVQVITYGKRIVGYFVPNKKAYRQTLESFLEDLEALSSKRYLEKIAKARKEKGGMTLKELKIKFKM